MAKDMTKGNPGKTLFFFAVPMVLGNLFQQLYNIIDSIIVGNYVGADALAAVGASSSITFLFVAIATGLSIGSSVVISQYFGAKRYGEMKTAIQTVLLASFVIALCLMLVGIFGTDAILRFMQTPQKIFSDASLYLKIYFCGLVFLFLYNMLTASFNAIGDSKSPLVFLALSSVCNIVLDLYFVTKLKMGVAGAALATDISQAISVVVSFLWLCTRMKKMKTQQKSRIFDLHILEIVCNVAVPSMLQQSMVSIGIFLVQRLVNGYGEAVMAGYAAATKIDSIAILPMVNVGNAVSTFTAQNIGGKKPERVKEGFRAGLLMSAVIGVIVTGILLVYAKVICRAVHGQQFQSGGDCHRHRIPACGRPVLCTDGYHEYLYRRTAGSRRHPLVFNGNADQLKLPCDPSLQHVRDARCKGYLVVDPDWLGHRLCNRFCTLLKRKMAEK